MFKTIGQKILVAYASAKIEAEIRRQKKVEKKELKNKKKKAERELRASVYCPYCCHLYGENEIYRNYYSPKDMYLRRIEYNENVYLSFMKCIECKEMFGIEKIYQGNPFDGYRSSFRLKGDE